MDDFNTNLFKAIENNDEKYFEEFYWNDIQYIDINLFENESDNEWYNYVKGFYYEIISKDYEKAIKFYELAANKGNSYAQYQLGKIYFFNNDYIHDVSKTLIYLHQASDQKHSKSQSVLAWIYWTEYNDYEKGIYYYQQCILNGYRDAYRQFARIYVELNDHRKAFQLYKDAIDKKYYEYYYYLAEFRPKLRKKCYICGMNKKYKNWNGKFNNYFLALMSDITKNNKQKYYLKLSIKINNDNYSVEKMLNIYEFKTKHTYYSLKIGNKIDRLSLYLSLILNKK